jgi:hypothetical protein
VQGGVIEQVLRHREVEIERARLEHHAEQPQRFAGRARDVMARLSQAICSRRQEIVTGIP